MNQTKKRIDNQKTTESATQTTLPVKSATQTPTNGDRLRAMSNEELAEYQITRADDCPDVIAPDAPCMVKNNYETHSDCKKCWLDWLNSPAESEEK